MTTVKKLLYRACEMKDGGYAIRDNSTDEFGSELDYIELPILRTAEHALQVCRILDEHGFERGLGPYTIGCSSFGLPPQLGAFLIEHRYVPSAPDDAEKAAMRFITRTLGYLREEDRWLYEHAQKITRAPYQYSQSIFLRLERRDIFRPDTNDMVMSAVFYISDLCDLIATYRKRYRLPFAKNESSLMSRVSEAWDCLFMATWNTKNVR